MERSRFRSRELPTKPYPLRAETKLSVPDEKTRGVAANHFLFFLPARRRSFYQ